MAKKSAVEKNKRRKLTSTRAAAKRADLKAVIYDKERPADERFEAVLRLAALPRDGSKTRVRNRCSLTGRPRAYYRKFGMSRLALRELASSGQIPGVTKASW